MLMDLWETLRSRFDNEMRRSHIAQWEVLKKDQSVKITTTIPKITHAFTAKHRGYMSGAMSMAVNEDISRMANREMLWAFANDAGVVPKEVETLAYVIIEVALKDGGIIGRRKVLELSGLENKMGANELFAVTICYLDEMRLLDDADKTLLNIPVITALVVDHWLMVLDRCQMLDHMRVGDTHTVPYETVQKILKLLKSEPREWFGIHKIREHVTDKSSDVQEALEYIMFTGKSQTRMKDDGHIAYKHGKCSKNKGL